jgi:hypothetical protein
LLRNIVVGIARWLLALKLALGTSAVGGLQALLAAVQLFADRRALRFRSHAGGVATSRLAHSLALVASQLLAGVLGAADRANRALAVDGALGARYLFTFHFALRASANWVADGRALRVIAHPLASRMAGAGSGQGHHAGILLGADQDSSDKEQGKSNQFHLQKKVAMQEAFATSLL